MRSLGLTHGRGYKPTEFFVMVDDEDFERLSQWNWSPREFSGIWYAVRMEGTSRSKSHPKGYSSALTILMHREVLGAGAGLLVDHRDRNGLNNQKANLRAATRQGNAANAKKKEGTSRFKGVFWDRSRNGWQDPFPGGLWTAAITVDYRSVLLGRFRDEIEAARAYDKASREYFGEFARTNFQDPSAPSDASIFGVER